MGCLCFLPRNYPLLLLGRIVSYRETRRALWLPEFRVDQLDFGWRERAPGEFSELLSQGNPIKIDGLGTFVPTVESTKEGITRAALLEGKWNANTYVKGIHIRFKPEGSAEDKITSVAFKDLCALSTYGVEEKVDLTPEESDPSKKQYIKKVTPLEDWIAEQKAQNP